MCSHGRGITRGEASQIIPFPTITSKATVPIANISSKPSLSKTDSDLYKYSDSTFDWTPQCQPNEQSCRLQRVFGRKRHQPSCCPKRTPGRQDIGVQWDNFGGRPHRGNRNVQIIQHSPHHVCHLRRRWCGNQLQQRKSRIVSAPILESPADEAMCRPSEPLSATQERSGSGVDC